MQNVVRYNDKTMSLQGLAQRRDDFIVQCPKMDLDGLHE